ncbi:sugar phosphate isomerase/epimerase family protein [Novosphingobium gossypii]|uniref:sugar phosphate isomerase/epimerase family protein n=1 Tax=Novosphingobium gossypii TaxID=1604774 RepID=UPI003D22BFD2
MPHPLGLELLTVLGLDPVAHATLAAELGCRTMSVGLQQVPAALNPHGYPGWSLRNDPPLRRAFRAALADHGVTIALAEGIDLSPQADSERWEADLDLMAELGAVRVSARDMGMERAQAFDRFALLARMVEQRGMELAIAFSPVLTIRSLDEALAAIAHIDQGQDGQDRLRATVLIDAMHFFRSGGTVRQIADLDPALIGCVQICDGARKGEGDYIAEQITGRMVPGQGELPLREFVDALPRGQGLGLAVPLTAAARSGRPASDYVAEVVRRTREFLA